MAHSGAVIRIWHQYPVGGKDLQRKYRPVTPHGSPAAADQPGATSSSADFWNLQEKLQVGVRPPPRVMTSRLSPAGPGRSNSLRTRASTRGRRHYSAPARLKSAGTAAPQPRNLAAIRISPVPRSRIRSVSGIHSVRTAPWHQPSRRLPTRRGEELRRGEDRQAGKGAWGTLGWLTW